MSAPSDLPPSGQPVPMAAENEPPHWLVQPETISKLWLYFSVILAMTVLAGLAVHIHAHFAIDGTFGFYAWYGLVTCAAMVFGARWLGKLLKVPDTYYQDDDEGKG